MTLLVSLFSIFSRSRQPGHYEELYKDHKDDTVLFSYSCFWEILPDVQVCLWLSCAELLLMSKVGDTVLGVCLDKEREEGWTVCCHLTYLFNHLYSDPFDLNHNLGAGLSRKSKLLLFVNLVKFLVLLMHVIEFSLFFL